jgi:predicted permease
MNRFIAAVRNLFAGRRPDRETEAELESYAGHAADAYERHGLSRADAERAARLDLGGVAQVTERVRDASAGRALESVRRDIAYGIRGLRRSPGFTLAVAGVLALGIGATTAIFSIVSGVLLQSLPVPHGDRLVRLFHTPPPESFPGITRFSVSPANYLDWKARSHSFDDLAIYGFGGPTLTGGPRAESITIARVSPNLFSMIDAVPAMGRLLTADDDRPGGGGVAVVSWSFWQSRFGGVALNGQSVILNGDQYAIVGVMPASFEWAAWSITGLPIWTPLAWTDADRAVRGNHNYNVVGRLRPGVSVAAASAELDAISADLAREHPVENTGWGATLVRLQDLIVAPVRRSLFILLGAVAFLLLIASANASNLILSRALSRQKEIAIRAALGASRARIIRQLMIETLLMAAVAAAAGLGLARLALVAFATYLQDQLPRATDVALDGRVVAVTIGVASVAGLLASLGPAIRASRCGVQDTLKQGLGRTDAVSAGRLGRRLLVGVEVALSLALLAGAGLMARSVWSLLHVDPGFDAANVLTFSVGVSQVKYQTPGARSAYFDAGLARLRAIPGVTDAAFVDTLPLGPGSMQPFTIVGRAAPAAADSLELAVRQISPGYFRAFRIPLVRGRDVDAHDANAVVVSESAARTFWPGADPIGQQMQFKFTPDVTFDVVGIVRDIRLESLDSDNAMPTVYQWMRERPWSSLTFVARTAWPIASTTPAALSAIEDLDPNQAVRDIATMTDRVAATTAPRRFELDLLGTFAVLAVALAGIGLFSVLAHAVRGRSREIAVRSALGASTAEIVRMVVVEGLKPTLGGLAAGLVIAWSLGPVLKSVLFGIGAFDPPTYAAGAAALIAVSCAAAIVPARRAAHLDPLKVLREE